MKKSITRLLAVLLVLGCVLALAACDEKSSGKPYTLAEGYKLYENDDLSFAYPSSWTLTDGSTAVMVGADGSNFNVAFVIANEENTDAFENMTEDTFMDLMGETLESMGMTLSGVEVETKTNDGGVEMVVCTYDATFAGKEISFCQYLIIGEEKHYTITATAFVSMEDAVEELFKSIRLK